VDDELPAAPAAAAPPRPTDRLAPIPTAPPFASYSAEQRIIRGFAVAVAVKGYPATTIADIAAASISQTTFYAGTLMIAHLVEPAYEQGLQPSQLQLELSAGAIYGVLFEGVRSGHTADLPRLAPFLT
jgi:hypothetical protein